MKPLPEMVTSTQPLAQLSPPAPVRLPHTPSLSLALSSAIADLALSSAIAPARIWLPHCTHPCLQPANTAANTAEAELLSHPCFPFCAGLFVACATLQTTRIVCMFHSVRKVVEGETLHMHTVDVSNAVSTPVVALLLLNCPRRRQPQHQPHPSPCPSPSASVHSGDSSSTPVHHHSGDH